MKEYIEIEILKGELIDAAEIYVQRAGVHGFNHDATLPRIREGLGVVTVEHRNPVTVDNVGDIISGLVLASTAIGFYH